MMSTLYKKLKEKLNDNRGSAMVLVIIAIAFVGTLVAMLVYLVYFNYLMKFTDREAKENFYTAESALEVVKAGIEQDVSDAMVASYYEVMSNNTSDSALNKQAAFEKAFRERLADPDCFNFMNPSVGGLSFQMDTYDPTALSDYWNRIVTTNPEYEGFKIATAKGDEGAWLDVYAWDSDMYKVSGVTDKDVLQKEGPVVIYNGSVFEMRNIRVEYIDEDGYVSVIETDIQIETPKVNFSNVMNIPRLEEYSLVAAGGIYNGYERRRSTLYTNKYVPTPVEGARSTAITGNVNGGEDGIFSYGVDSQIHFTKQTEDSESRVFYVTADTISAASGRTQSDVANNRPAQTPSILVDEYYEVWADDLYAESATMDISASCFVRDDLTTDGSYPGVYLRGAIYSGYGDETVGAEGSSAILINGANTTLNMSELGRLQLSGYANVGAIHYYAGIEDASSATSDYIEDVDEYWEEKEKADAKAEADGTSTSTQEPEIEKNDKNDVLMGQSLAVKADQLIYMVPVECMGYDGDTQILGKNPMTYDEYTKFATAYKPLLNSDGTVATDPTTGEIMYSEELKYDVVRLDVIMNKVGGSINSYGADYVPVFRRVNGDILVYFYIKFVSPDKANEFFRDYYANDPESFENYVESYIRSYTINPNIAVNGSGNLNLAGNMLVMRGGNISLKYDTTEEDLPNFETMYNERQSNMAYYQNLSKYLMKSTDDLSAIKIQNNVFTNLTIDEAEFAKHVAPGKFSKYKNADDKVVALVINNAGNNVFEIGTGNEYLNMTAAELADVHLIIATGDVKISVKDYDGLILCGGDIYINSVINDTIDYDVAQVPIAMTAISEDGQYVFEVIQNGAAYANAIGTSDDDLKAAIEQQRESDIVRASDLVRFVNWNKE